MKNLKERLIKAKEIIEHSDYVLIGGGAGLSAAAGLTYSGKRFTDHFSDFMDKYGFRDMYSGTFYPFETQEELWAHWARHIDVNRYLMPATQLYQEILKLVKEKQYFVITTNVESQFVKAGFPEEKIFEVQGNYAYLQCANGCHDQVYENESLIQQMVQETNDCKIPSSLVPKCPKCKGKMDVNLRHNDAFIQDAKWYEMQVRYDQFLEECKGKQLVLLEFGVGFNTPGIIRYPFERLVYQNPQTYLLRFNKDYPEAITENLQKTLSFDEEILDLIFGLQGNFEIDQNVYELDKFSKYERNVV